jgi:hypothetical protein
MSPMGLKRPFFRVQRPFSRTSVVSGPWSVVLLPLGAFFSDKSFNQADSPHCLSEFLLKNTPFVHCTESLIRPSNSSNESIELIESIRQVTVQIVLSLRSFKTFKSIGEHNILVQTESFEIGHRGEAGRAI